MEVSIDFVNGGFYSPLKIKIGLLFSNKEIKYMNLIITDVNAIVHKLLYFFPEFLEARGS